MDKIYDQTIEYVKDNFGNFRGYIVGLLFFLLIGLIIINKIDIVNIGIIEITILVIIILIFTLIWLNVNKLPKNKKYKIGFVLSLATEKNQESEKIKKDFISEIGKLLNEGNYRYDFQIIEMKQIHAVKINNVKTAKEYLIQMNAHFMLYGDIKIRKFNGKDTYCLDANYVVRHKEVEERIKKEFSKEITQVMLPGKHIINRDNELILIPFVSNFVEKAAIYIIAYASIISFDLKYAESLLKSLRGNVPNEGKYYKDFCEKIDEKLIFVYLALASDYYIRYKQGKRSDDLEHVKHYLDEIDSIKQNNYPANLLRSIYYFYKRDLKKAKATINKCKNGPDNTWRFSDAFLVAYENDIEKALKNYKRLINYKYDLSIILDVEEFIQNIINDEPDKAYLYYFLGMINYHIKKDYKSARRDFLAFLRSRYYRDILGESAKEYIRESKQRMLELVKNK